MAASPDHSLPKMIREPQIFRFRLRQMMWFVAGLSALCAMIVRTDGAWPMVIGVAALMVGGHVFGTMVGTRLRDHSRELQSFRSARTVGGDDPVIGPLSMSGRPMGSSTTSSSTATPLAIRECVSPWAIWVVAAGAALGGLAGVVGISVTIIGPLTWSELAVGSIACGVLGAWFGYLAGGVGFTSRRAWKHAHGATTSGRR